MKVLTNEQKSKALPFWIQALGRLGINSAKSALEKRLEDGSPEEELVLAIAEPLNGTITEFSDSEPDNSKKVRALWLKWLNTFMSPWLFRLFQPVVDSIKIDYNRKMLQYLKDFASQVGLLLTDEIRPNGDQIGEYAKAEGAKESTKKLVIEEFAGGNLTAAGLNADLVAFFVEAAEIGWDAILNKSTAMAMGVFTQELDEVTIITLPSGRMGTFTRMAA